MIFVLNNLSLNLLDFYTVRDVSGAEVVARNKSTRAHNVSVSVHRSSRNVTPIRRLLIHLPRGFLPRHASVKLYRFHHNWIFYIFFANTPRALEPSIRFRLYVQTVSRRGRSLEANRLVRSYPLDHCIYNRSPFTDDGYRSTVRVYSEIRDIHHVISGSSRRQIYTFEFDGDRWAGRSKRR